MAVSTHDMANVNAVFGWGNDMGAYLNRGYYYNPGYYATFPANNIGMNMFIGTAPTPAEWACDCSNCSMK